MTTDEEILALRERMRALNKKKHKRFNVLLRTESFQKLERLAKKNDESKAGMLNKIINEYD